MDPIPDKNYYVSPYYKSSVSPKLIRSVVFAWMSYKHMYNMYMHTNFHVYNISRKYKRWNTLNALLVALEFTVGTICAVDSFVD